MGWGAGEEKAIRVVIATLALGLLLQCRPALAVADCSQAPTAASSLDTAAVGGHSLSLHSGSLRTVLQGAVSIPGPASSQASCRRSTGALVSVASALLPRSYVARPLIDGYSVSAATGTVAREMRMEMNPRVTNSAQAEPTRTTDLSLERRSGLEARFGVRWQTMPGPAWVQRVPSWLVEDAKTYHRRGLPVLHLWESSNYLVALGLSNHGVPGVYFSQKLP
jgi:hypothetical protein